MPAYLHNELIQFNLVVLIFWTQSGCPVFTLNHFKSREYKILFHCSHLEIYNEKVRDLLCDTGQKVSQLKIRQHPQKGPYVQGKIENLQLHNNNYSTT